MVSLKNPLNFIKKANRTFNVYLGNYKRIDDFLNAYERDQQKSDAFLNAFLDIYGENQEKTNKFIEKYEHNQEKTDAFLNAFLDIYGENQEKTNKFIEKYEHNQEKTDAFLNAFLDIYGENQEKTNKFIEKYEHNQEKTNAFMDSYISIRENLKTAIDTFNQNYDICKGYFFNGDENSFEMMDTDQFFQMCFFNNIQLLSHSPSENRIYLETEEGIKLVTNNRFYTIGEIYARDGYSVPQLYQFKEFVVFDIGMNRGYAALKFANYDSCKAVYGFEINQDTYDFAIENLDLNPELAHKIKAYNFGLSDKDDEIDIYCLPGSDGITTTELEFTNVQAEWLKGKEQMKIKKANVKEASAIILNILKKGNINSNIVLKIDTEGSEHKILDNLIDKDVLDKVDLIMGENHLLGEDLDEKLVGFKNISKKFYTNDIYSFCYVKDEYFKKLPQAKF
ncbi:methyltransferase FkbM family [Methanobacterium formicicum]|uniref:Methyltransferase FkbM family n=1 Tax=Methanobacterium formicicum TaxID=2162 RepID=A0A089ZBY3_METFO|nr:FkbM family methyltransferase [Methanobacterium formicicum]AIS31507.1 methyltransferase FkbM family [Methanobacterium formicicum]